MQDDIAAPVRRFWEDVWTKGDVAVLHEIIAEGATENGQPLIAAEFAEGVAAWQRKFSPFSATIEELLVLGDRVVTRVTYRGKHLEAWGPLPATGAGFTVGPGIDLFRVRDGRIVELWHAVDHMPMVQALGGRIAAREEHPDSRT